MQEENLSLEDQLKVAKQQAEAYKAQAEAQYSQIKFLQTKLDDLIYKTQKVKVSLDSYVQLNATFINLLGKELI